MKVDMSDVAAVLQEVLKPEDFHRVTKEIEAVANESKIDEAPTTPVKYAPLIVCTDPNVDLSAVPLFLIEHQDTMNHVEAIEAFQRVITSHNAVAKKGKIISSIGKAFIYLSGKVLKDAGFKIRHREVLISTSVVNSIDSAKEAEDTSHETPAE